MFYKCPDLNCQVNGKQAGLTTFTLSAKCRSNADVANRVAENIAKTHVACVTSSTLAEAKTVSIMVSMQLESDGESHLDAAVDS